MQRLVVRRRAPRRFHLPHAVVHVLRVRSLEVDDFLDREERALLERHAVQVSVYELLLAGDDLDPRRRHRPQLHRHAEPTVDDRMEVRVARQLKVKHAQDGLLKAVLPRVRLRQQVEDRVRVGDHFVVIPVLCGLRHRVPRRELIERTRQIRLGATSCLARVPQFRTGAAVPDVQAQRLRGDRVGVEVRRRVDPRPVVPDRRLRRERGTHGVA